MSARSRLRSFLSALLRRRRLEDDMAEEMRHHLQSRADALEAEGLPRAEAIRRARREFGDPLRWREQGREARGLGWIQDLGADVRYAFRQMRRSPGFTFIVIATFALGIGSTTAIFSAVDAVALRALPFDQHDRLVAVGPEPRQGITLRVGGLTAPDYLDWHARQDVFESFAGYAVRQFNLEWPDRPPENVSGLMVAPEYFDVLRARPAVGRALTPDPDAIGRETEAVVSYGFWQSHFGGDPNAIGSTLRLQGFTYEVVGVMPASFLYPLGVVSDPEVWVPLVIAPGDRVRGESHNYSIIAIGRLKDGVSIERAADRMAQITVAIEQEHPEFDKNVRGTVVPLADQVIGQRTRSWMLLLLGAVLLVLLVACVNVAGLMVARGTSRQQEIGIRAAIGAGRWRIVRQLLVEALVLAGAGAAIGITLARWGVEILRTAMPDNVPRVSAIALDTRILMIAVAATFAVGLASGLLPAWQCSQPDLTASLKDGGRSLSVSRAGRRTRGALVVAELALAVVLLVGAGLFVASFVKLMRIDLGFNPDSVLTVTINPGFGPEASRRGVAALRTLVERLDGAPGVTAVAAATGTTPITTMLISGGVTIPGRELPPDARGMAGALATPGFARALGMRVRAGRFFDEHDLHADPGALVLSALAAQRFFPGENPVGQEVEFMGRRRVVGVVDDVRWPETTALAVGYVPFGSDTPVGAGSLVIKTAGDPLALVPLVRSAVYDVLPDVPLRDVQTMDEIVWRRTAQRRLNMLLLGLFGVLGLAIASVGLYGLMAYVVAEQTREIGIRIALGATRGHVVGMFLRRAIALVVAGLAIGAPAAWALRRTASSFLFQMDPGDPRIFVAALAVLAASALVASWLPARRAANVDPLIALRSD